MVRFVCLEGGITHITLAYNSDICIGGRRGSLYARVFCRISSGAAAEWPVDSSQPVIYVKHHMIGLYTNLRIQHEIFQNIPFYRLIFICGSSSNLQSPAENNFSPRVKLFYVRGGGCGQHRVRPPRKNFNKFALAVICKLRCDPATPNGIGICRQGRIPAVAVLLDCAGSRAAGRLRCHTVVVMRIRRSPPCLRNNLC